MAPKLKFAILLCAVVFSVMGLYGQESSAGKEQSCLHFTQAFYDWYTAQVFKSFESSNGKMPLREALKYDGNPFGSELKRALMESEAEAKADGDPVLDFYPILNSQDPAERYVVRKVTRKNGHYWAEIYGVWSRTIPEQDKGLQVVAEMAFTGGRWQFVNFHYPNHTSPGNENLLSILKYRYHS